MADEDRSAFDAQIEAAMREIAANVDQEVRAEREEEAARKAAEAEEARAAREERIREAAERAEEAAKQAAADEAQEPSPDAGEDAEPGAEPQAAADAAAEAGEAAADEAAADEAEPEEAADPVVGAIAPHEEGLSTEQIVKSRRLRKRYIAAIVVLILAIVLIVGALVVNFFMPKQAAENTEAAQTSLVEQAAETGETASATKASTQVPDLVDMLGATEADAAAVLGDKAGEKSVTAVEQEVPEAAEGEEAPEVEELDSDIVSVERIDIKVDGETSSKAAPAVYLTLRRDGYVQEVYYTCDLDLLGSGLCTFDEMIADTEQLAKFLSAAGIEADATTLGTADPSKVETVMGKDKEGKAAPETKSYLFWDYASTGGDEGVWEVSVNYDYSAANKSGDATDVLRTVGIRVA